MTACAQARPGFDVVARAGIADRDLMHRHRDGDPLARRTLIERYIPLARRLALRYRRAPEPLDDLVQVASLGLVKAVDRWDPDRGTAFSTYAVPTILGELRRHFRDATWVVRPPRDLQELSLTVESAREPLNAAIGHEPTVADFAERLGRSSEAIAEAMVAAESRAVRSLDSPVHEDRQGSATIGELIGGDDGEYDRAEARTAVEQLTVILDQQAREILRLRFQEDLFQAEIADRVGCSQMHVSRSLRSSLRKLSAYGSAESRG
jgi:RNA polymerase sigma-B factor